MEAYSLISKQNKLAQTAECYQSQGHALIKHKTYMRLQEKLLSMHL